MRRRIKKVRKKPEEKYLKVKLERELTPREKKEKPIYLPFSLSPYPFTLRLSAMFRGLSKKIASRKKDFQLQLEQAEISASGSKYFSLCLASSFFSFIVFAIFFSAIFWIIDVNFLYSLPLALVLFLFTYNHQITYPRLKALRKVKETEEDLLPALRTLLVQISSGVVFFDALKTVSRGDYGTVSREFDKVIKRIEAGQSSLEALEFIVRTNPSVYFRRSVWQIMVAMKSGSDITIVLQSLINNMNLEQLTKIREYSAKLSPLSMLYMLFTIILPALAISFLLVLSFFISAVGNYINFILWGGLALILILQIAFIGLIKSGRPRVG